ncbi:MAG: cytochrome c [Phycisphaerae bacterium]|nr:cytochrome c [Gemmatimonadaceae bacterium]
MPSFQRPQGRGWFARIQAPHVAAVGIVLAGMILVQRPQTLAARDAEPTFAEDIAPILYKNCTSCHHTGGLGPFSLVEYDSAKANLRDIRDAVSTQQMPPWHAAGEHGVFLNDRRLTENERALILRWVDAGGKSGNLKNLPPRPVYAAKWEIGTPDVVATMPNEFVVPAKGTIEYQYFEVPVNTTEDKWVQAIEILPGARDVVHHVLVYARVPDAAGGPPAPRPAGTPATPPLIVRNRQHGIPDDAPRSDPRNAPPRQMGALIGTTAPGTNVLMFPKGTALRLRKGTVLTFQMHYTAHGHETPDRTSVGFRFASEMPDEEMFASAFFNGAFVLPAGAKDVEVPAEIGVSQPIKVWALFPHTHVRGTRWEYKLQKPDGTSEMILDVPRYDFNWQTYYMFAKPLDIPVGSMIKSRAWYDNSATNKHNPDATKKVTWGDQTWEEMQYTGFLYTVPSRRLR